MFDYNFNRIYFPLYGDFIELDRPE